MRTTLLPTPLRPLAPRCRGGASSMLRLTPSGARSVWGGLRADTAAQALAPWGADDGDDAPPLFTPLHPSPGVVQPF